MAAADLIVLIGYFVAVLAVGLWAGRRERNTTDYFLGGRRQHWLAVGISIIASEVSAITVIAVPAESFLNDWTYLQMYAGAFLGRILILFLLLPAFYGGRVTTVYQYIGQRFGPWSRTATSLMFFASRMVGSGIRLLVAAVAVATVFAWDEKWVILGAAGVAAAYTTFGGVKSIIWTEVLQAFVFMGSAVAVIVYVLVQLDGGWWGHIQAAHAAQKFNVFTFSADVNNDKSFWVLLIHATVLNMAALGTDQDLTQRMLTCPDLRRAQQSLLFNAFAAFPVVCAFLFIGTLLWIHFHATGSPIPESVVEKNDRVFPFFIAHVLPEGYGLRGLVMTGVLAATMSSLAPAIGALATTAVTDFYRPYQAWRQRRGKGHPSTGKDSLLTSGGGAEGTDREHERHLMFVSRLATFAFSVVLIAVAMAFIGHDRLLWQVFQWAGLFFGPMLGVFLLGVTTKTRGNDAFNVAAMLSAFLALVAIKVYQERYETVVMPISIVPMGTAFLPLEISVRHGVLIAWPWWVVIGCAWTYAVGLCARTASRRKTRT